MTRTEYVYDLVDSMVETINHEHHALCEHGWTPDSHLIARMHCERKSGASCFSKGIDIAELIIDAIFDASELVPWAGGAVKDDLTIVADCENCGKKFTKACEWCEGGAIACNRFKVVLGKQFDAAGCLSRLYLKSAYPI